MGCEVECVGARLKIKRGVAGRRFRERLRERGWASLASVRFPGGGGEVRCREERVWSEAKRGRPGFSRSRARVRSLSFRHHAPRAADRVFLFLCSSDLNDCSDRALPHHRRGLAQGRLSRSLRHRRIATAPIEPPRGPLRVDCPGPLFFPLLSRRPTPNLDTQAGLITFVAVLWRILVLHPAGTRRTRRGDRGVGCWDREELTPLRAGIFTYHPAFNSVAVLLFTQGARAPRRVRSSPRRR